MTDTDDTDHGPPPDAPRQDRQRGRYHHGDLRSALIAEALDSIARSGPSSLSLRAVAKAAGVSNAAPVHHFGDKPGLFTAIAIEGHTLLREHLDAVWREHHSMLEVGVAYVGFAVAHRAHFEVMFRTDLHRDDDRTLIAARDATGRVLTTAATSVASGLDQDAVRVGAAGWSLMHGVAELWLNGNLPRRLGDDPREVARDLGSFLFRT
jgi:AcrR family transcriptional regulator